MTSAFAAWVRFMEFVPRRIPRVLRRIVTGNGRSAAKAKDDFDLLHGTDTAGIIKVYKLDSVTDSYIHSHGYEPCETGRLRKALATPAIARENYEFVDIGCGKGRALIVASEMGFRKVTGVEISPMLSKVASKNLEVCGIEGTIVNGDASTFSIPESHCVCYLFDPFGKRMMEKFSENAKERIKHSAQDLWIIYQAPEYRRVFDSNRRLETVAQARDTAIYRARV
jgi:SAM-dependent methyltransferase